MDINILIVNIKKKLFEQINIDLSDLNSATIKKPKLQETSTLKLLNCFIKKTFANHTKPF